MRAASGYACAKWLAAASVIGAAVVLSGCQTAPIARPEVTLAPSLQLLEAEPLVLASDCAASGSYFVEFTVLENGRTSPVQPPPAPACVQQALMAWISSFRYSPPATATISGIEWMVVSARGGS